MNDQKLPVEALLQSFKGNEATDSRLMLPVKDEDGENIGSLVCVDRGLAIDSEIIAEMTNWRKRYMQYFLTQFEATEERTRAWLTDIVLPSRDRLMFLIFAERDRLIGNFGVCAMRERIGELDNLIRGNKGGAPRLIHFCEISLLWWLFDVFRYERVNLHVFSHNKPTIRLHRNIGFSVIASHSLSRITTPDGLTYKVASSEGETVDFRYLEMAIERKIFLSRYPWVRDIYSGSSAGQVY